MVNYLSTRKKRTYYTFTSSSSSSSTMYHDLIFLFFSVVVVLMTITSTTTNSSTFQLSSSSSSSYNYYCTTTAFASSFTVISSSSLSHRTTTISRQHQHSHHGSSIIKRQKLSIVAFAVRGGGKGGDGESYRNNNNNNNNNKTFLSSIKKTISSSSCCLNAKGDSSISSTSDNSNNQQQQQQQQQQQDNNNNDTVVVVTALIDEPQQLFDDDDMNIPTITSPTDPFPKDEINPLMDKVDDIIDEVDTVINEVTDVISGDTAVTISTVVVEEKEQNVDTKKKSRSVETVHRGGGGRRDEISFATPDQPTLTQILKFALPCLALWIANPLLSLVDTATVGLSASEGTGAIQLGALGPATTFIDGSTYLFAFLNVATTNLYASALAKARQSNPKTADNDINYLKYEGSGVARTAIRISLWSGFGLLALLLSSCVPILRLYIGASPNDTSITNPASQYIKIRALSMPTSLLYGVVQAALLGAKDSVTPLIAIAYSTIVNTLGDLYLVCYLKKGIVGAAIATTIAQWVGTIAMIRPMKNKLFPSKDYSTKTERKTSSARAFLAFAAPVLTLIVGKIAAFGVLTHVAAAVPPYETSLAAHQIILTLFFFISPFLEVISQTAQSFLPAFYTARDDALSKGYKHVSAADKANKEAKVLSLRLLKLGMGVGCIMGLLSSFIPAFIPGILTNSVEVQNAVKPLALPLAFGSLLTAPVAVSEGVLLARRDLKFLAGVYLLSTALLPTALIKFVKQPKLPVINVWYGFVIFQLFRSICFTTRIWGNDIILYIKGNNNKKNTTN